MRKVIVSMMVSLDGFIEAPEHDINWHIWDDEMGSYMMDFMQQVDTFLYGRVSYELMLQYWPDAKGPFADRMNETRKIVFSRTLSSVSWNAILIKDDIPGKINELKQQPGKDMVLFAGADILSTFTRHDLVDEYRLMVNPVVLGKGTPYFKNMEQQLKLTLTGSRSFSCGNVLLCYAPVR